MSVPTPTERSEEQIQELLEKLSPGVRYLMLTRLSIPEAWAAEAAAEGFATEKMLAQLYISMLGLPPDSESAKELISWKRPSALSRASAGDFPEKAFAVIESRCPSAESLGPRRVTIADMNALLEEPWTRGPRAEQTCPGHVVDVSIRSSPLRTAPPRSRPVGSRS